MSTSTDNRRPAKRVHTVLVFVAVMVLGTSCTASTTSATGGSGSTQPPPPTVTTVSPTSAGRPPAAPDRSRARLAETIERSLRRATAALPARVAVSFYDAEGSIRVGPDITTTAWSTIKVPLAIAAGANPSDATADLIAAAITKSDNDAAEALWEGLGPASSAAAEVDRVLAAGGDARTRVPDHRTRSEFTVFGQTDWTLELQARFAAGLPCIPAASSVLALMSRLTPSQQWGLAAQGVPAKGGWGPDENGRYLVRQIAVMHGVDGVVGVAIAAQADDGSFASGVSALNELAPWVAGRLPLLHGTRCPVGGTGAAVSEASPR